MLQLSHASIISLFNKTSASIEDCSFPTHLNKKISIIALFVLGSLCACYQAARHYFNATKLDTSTQTLKNKSDTPCAEITNRTATVDEVADLFNKYSKENVLSTNHYIINSKDQLEMLQKMSKITHEWDSKAGKEYDKEKEERFLDAKEQLFRDASSAAFHLYSSLKHNIPLYSIIHKINPVEIITSQRGDEILGIAVIEPKKDTNSDRDRIYLEVLATNPENIAFQQKGSQITKKTRGVGSSIILEIFRICSNTEKNLTLVALPSAIPFYEKLGFVKDDSASSIDGTPMIITVDKIKEILCKRTLNEQISVGNEFNPLETNSEGF